MISEEKQKEAIPNHQLIVAVVRAVRLVRRREHIVGHIGADICSGRVRPLDRVGDLTDVADQLHGQIATRVWKALDVVGASRPSPVRVPGDAADVGTVDIRALRASSIAGTPLVIVEVPSVVGIIAIGITEALKRCPSSGKEGSQPESVKFHGDERYVKK